MKEVRGLLLDVEDVTLCDTLKEAEELVEKKGGEVVYEWFQCPCGACDLEKLIGVIGEGASEEE